VEVRAQAREKERWRAQQQQVTCETGKLDVKP